MNMNFLKRAIITTQIPLSSGSLRKCILLLLPITQSSLYSAYRLNNPQPTKSRTRKPKEPSPPPSLSSSSISSPKVKDQAQIDADWPRPSEIPYQAKVANLVNLIGHIKSPIKFQSSPDGKSCAAAIISRENVEDKSCLIPILFEGDLAHVATYHVKKNDCVYVIGQLIEDPMPFVLSESQGNFHVLVQNINFVQGFERKTFENSSKKNAVVRSNFDPKYSYTSYDLSKKSGGVLIDSTDFCSDGRSSDNVKHSWHYVLDKPHEWWDIRSEGADGRPVGLAFEHKDNGRLLCIDISTPDWVLRKLESVKFDKKHSRTSLISADKGKDESSISDSWKDLVNNPKQWRDYREQKFKGTVSAKYPDFKHKDSGTALWLSSSPKWVLSGLERLDFDVSPPKQTRSNVSLPKQMRLKDAKEDVWKSLIENPSQWWDNRLDKKNIKGPDFKHKETGEALWLNSSPDWVLSKLPPQKEKRAVGAV